MGSADTDLDTRLTQEQVVVSFILTELWKYSMGDCIFNPELCNNDSEARRARPPDVSAKHSPCLRRTGLTESSWMGVSTNPLEKAMFLQNRKPPLGQQRVWLEQVFGDMRQLRPAVSQKGSGTALLPLHVTVMDLWPLVQGGVIISVAVALFHPCQLCWHLAQHLLGQLENKHQMLCYCFHLPVQCQLCQMEKKTQRRFLIIHRPLHAVYMTIKYRLKYIVSTA